MRFVEFEISIKIDEDMDSEEVNDLVQRSIDRILKQ